MSGKTTDKSLANRRPLSTNVKIANSGQNSYPAQQNGVRDDMIDFFADAQTGVRDENMDKYANILGAKNQGQGQSNINEVAHDHSEEQPGSGHDRDSDLSRQIGASEHQKFLAELKQTL